MYTCYAVSHTQFLLPGYCPEAWSWRLCPQIKLESPPHLLNFCWVHMLYHAHSCPNFHCIVNCVSEAVCVGWCWKGVLHKLHFLVWDHTFLLVEVLQFQILVGGKQVWLRRVWMSNGRHFSDARRTVRRTENLPSSLIVFRRWRWSQTTSWEHQCLETALSWVSSMPCVIQDLCWESSGLMRELCSWILAWECVCVVLGFGSVNTCALLLT